MPDYLYPNRIKAPGMPTILMSLFLGEYSEEAHSLIKNIAAQLARIRQVVFFMTVGFVLLYPKLE